MIQLPAMPREVAAVFAEFPDTARGHLTQIRGLIFDEAARQEVGPLTETLKWGQPAYLTEATKAGTTLRLGCSKKHPGMAQVFVHCQTTLVDRWRERFPELQFEGNRVLHLPLAVPLPEPQLRICLAMALRYHQ